MIRLMKTEFRKVWCNRFFIFLWVVLLSINTYCLWIYCRASYPSTAYHAISSQLSGKSMTEKKMMLYSEQERVKSLLIIDNITREEATNGGKTLSQIRDKYASEFKKYEAIYETGNHLKYCSSLSDEYGFINKIVAEFDTVNNYSAFLDRINKNAQDISTISIFVNAETSYTRKSLSQTVNMYSGMHDTPIDYWPQIGIYTAIRFLPTDIVLFAAMLFIVLQLTRSELDSGLAELIRSTPNGRFTTAVAKTVALCQSLAVVVLFLYSTNILYCAIRYGLGDILRSVQSLPSLMRSVLHINILQYLLLFFLAKWVSAVTIGIWCMLTNLMAKNTIGGMIYSIFAMFIGLIIRFLIPANSHWNLIKYSNFVSLLQVNEFLGDYQNIYWFGIPVPIFLVELLTAILYLLVSITLFFYCYSCAQINTPSKSNRPHFHHIKKRKHSTSMQKIEWKKFGITNGAFLVLLLFLCYQFNQYRTISYYLNRDEIYKRYYVQQIEGPINSNTVRQLLQHVDEFEPIRDAQKSFAKKEINLEQYETIMHDYQSLERKHFVWKQVYDQVRQIIQHPQKNAPPFLVYSTGYEKLFDIDDSYDLNEAFITVLVCVLCFSGFFALEKQTGMHDLILSTPKGRADTVKCKIKCINLSVFVITICSIIPRLYAIIRDYGLNCFWGPVCSLSGYEQLPHIPIIVLLLLFFIFRFTALRLVSGITSVLSDKYGNMIFTFLTSSCIFLLPIILSFSGFKNAKWASSYLAFHAIAMFRIPSDAFFLILLLVENCFSIVLSDYFLIERASKMQ